MTLFPSNEAPDAGCQLCPDLCKNRSHIVLPTPPSPGGILAIGEGPGEDEDALGVGFVGRAGKTLDALMLKHGLRRDDGYGVANIVRCRPPANRRPTPREIAACLPLLAQTILRVRPSVLLLVGGTASAAVVGAGQLATRIAQSRASAFCDFSFAHEALRSELRSRDPEAMRRGLYAIPMPHTSPLAWNRSAPDGVRWSLIGEHQVALAVELSALSRLDGRNCPSRTDAPCSIR